MSSSSTQLSWEPHPEPWSWDLGAVPAQLRVRYWQIRCVTVWLGSFLCEGLWQRAWTASVSQGRPKARLGSGGIHG